VGVIVVASGGRAFSVGGDLRALYDRGRAGRYEEALEILELAFTQERFSFSGKYYHLDDVSVVPKPLQKPYPPVYMVGTSGAAFEIGARKGWALAFGGPAPVAAFKPGVDRYREACAKYGTKPTVACARCISRRMSGRRKRSANVRSSDFLPTTQAQYPVCAATRT